MGCTASKSLEMQARMDGWSPPISKSFVRSFSMPLKHLQQSPSRTRDSAAGVEDLHIVALTSSTYGALTIPDEDDAPQEQQQQEDKEQLQVEAPVVKESAKLSDAKSLPSVPEAEVIDLWELMKDLNDVEQQQPRTINRKRKGSGARVLSRSISSVDSMRELDVKIRSVALALPNLEKKLRALDALNSISLSGEQQQQDGRGFHLRSSRKSIEISSSNISANCRSLESSPPRSKQQLESAKSLKGLFYGATLDSESEHPSKRLNTSLSASSYCSSSSYDASSSGDSEESSSSSLFDPEILKTFQQQSDASSPHSSEQLDSASPDTCRLVSSSRKMLSSKVAAIEVEEQRLRVWDSFPEICPPKGDDRAVLYVTSLRGIRKTFEDCSKVRMILQGFGISIDERDVSMHAEFRQELKELLSQLRTTSEEKPVLAVPRLFIRGRYVAGVEEVVQLNEEGVIAKLVEGIPRQDSKEVCDGCGGARFVPCFECSGSCKIVKFGGGVGNFSGSGVIVRCSDCNENGLIRCPVCF